METQLTEQENARALEMLTHIEANPDITQRLIDQQCSVQWRGFLQALAAEFAAALPPEDLRALMFRVGVRFAAEHPLPACATLDDLQSSMAAVWDRIGWGGVHLQQGRPAS